MHDPSLAQVNSFSAHLIIVKFPKAFEVILPLFPIIVNKCLQFYKSKQKYKQTVHVEPVQRYSPASLDLTSAIVKVLMEVKMLFFLLDFDQDIEMVSKRAKGSTVHLN